ncbi:MAG: sulfatase [Myxococcota bacterium]
MVLALLAGCALLETAVDVPPVARRDEGPDVVFVVLDTLRADALMQYGYGELTSPNLGAFVRHATRFEAAYAPAPWTVPSTTTILTGVHPLRHGMRHPGDVVPAALDTLAERLRGAGWRTAAFSHNISVAPKNGFDQGFDSFTTFSGDILDYPHAGEMTAGVRGWLDANPTGPAFLYLQPMNCHGPYKVPKASRETLLGRAPLGGFRYYQGPMRDILKRGDLAARARVAPIVKRSLREQYDTSVRYATDEVGRLFAELEAKGRYDNALIVLTADHGEELFDHGGFSHGYSLHREVLHVPLWVKLPGQKRATVVSEPVSLADLVPTVLDSLALSPSADGPAAPPMDGRSLTPLLRGESLPARPLLFDIDWGRRAVAQAVLDGSWKLIRIQTNYEGLRDVTRLYDVAADPLESTDLSATEPARVTTLGATLDRLAASYAGGATPENVLSEMDAAQLEALGYLE